MFQYGVFKLMQANRFTRDKHGHYIVISSLLFGLEHWYNLRYIVFAFSAGLPLAYTYYLYHKNHRKAFWNNSCGSFIAQHNRFANFLPKEMKHRLTTLSGVNFISITHRLDHSYKENSSIISAFRLLEMGTCISLLSQTMPSLSTFFTCALFTSHDLCILRKL